MAAHLGSTPTREESATRFFWCGIINNVLDFTQKCDRCQRQSNLPSNLKNEMHSVPVSPLVMKQVALDLCSLSEADGYRHLIVCIAYFTYWLESKPIRDKTALMVAPFLYEFMFRHGCFKVQIKDQVREFVNVVCFLFTFVVFLFLFKTFFTVDLYIVKN